MLSNRSIVDACLALLIGVLCIHPVEAEDAPAEPPEKADVEKVELPGITIDAKNKWIDVDAKVALDDGLLELVACIKDTKEHESLVTLDAAPVHIHTALLLIGAQNGHPARVKPANEERTQWLHLPPKGDPIGVSLVYPDPEDEKKTIERPISDFIKRAERDLALDPDEQADLDDPAKVFDTFVFAGSVLIEREGQERQYLADQSGNIVSISTFGDEVLCLPSRVSSENAALVWSVNDKHLPKVGTKVRLRLTLKTEPDEQGGPE